MSDIRSAEDVAQKHSLVGVEARPFSRNSGPFPSPLALCMTCGWIPCSDYAKHVVDFIRARDAEVRADERAKVLAELTEETRTREDGHASMYSSYDRTKHTYTKTSSRAKPPTRERRLVSPWKKVIDD